MVVYSVLCEANLLKFVGAKELQQGAVVQVVATAGMAAG
jgi:hypothetical protein